MIIIGTSGYHFPDWTGIFYPPGLEKKYWLQFYAKHFLSLEINNTYYGIPSEETVARWDRFTPDGFAFVIKLHQDITHHRKNKADEATGFIKRFRELEAKGKVAGYLAQFPASFHKTTANEQYLRLLAERMAGKTLFVEFRHQSWDHGDSIHLCRDLHLSWVMTDQPNLRGLAKVRVAATTNLAYVRFHGRNARTWYHSELGDRYDWEYSDRELKEWIPRLKVIDSRAELSYLFFNNCHAGQAIKSALRMKQLLGNQLEVI